MIDTGLPYLLSLVLLSGGLVLFARKSRWRLFDLLPAVVLLYFLAMLLSTLGLWEKTPETVQAYKTVKSALLPAMIFWMLLKADLRKLAALGPRLLLAFFTASATIALGFVAMFALFKPWLEPGAHKAFAALAGSWMGGTGNMVAVQGALEIPDAALGYTLLVDSVDYAVWVMLLLALVPAAPLFNRWTQSDTSALDRAAARMEEGEEERKATVPGIALLLLSGGAVTFGVQQLSPLLPTGAYVSGTTWTVVLATLAGTAAAVTPLGKTAGSGPLASAALYLLVALIASRADFGELAQAPLYVAAGFVILGVHGALMLLAAKLFRLDLFSCAVASLANIGGVASAPILAASYHRSLVPVAVLMAMAGYLIGTFGGLAVGKALSLL